MSLTSWMLRRAAEEQLDSSEPMPTFYIKSSQKQEKAYFGWQCNDMGHVTWDDPLVSREMIMSRGEKKLGSGPNLAIGLDIELA